MPSLSPQLCALLTPGVVAKLKQHGVRTVADFVSMDAGHLAHRTGIPFKDLTSIRRSLLAQFASLAVTAADLWEEMDSIAALFTTGCSSLDHLLDGGVLTGELTEITGPPGSGKTQLCMSLAAQVAMDTASTVVVVDTGGSFSAERLHKMMLGREGAKEEAALQRVHVHHAFTVFDLLTTIYSLKHKIAQQVDTFHSNLHLVIIDGVTALLSPLLGGHQAQGHALLCQLATSLNLLAHDHSVAIVYTNNMVSDMESVSGLKPALGRTWSHVPNTRVTLGCSHSPVEVQRTATLSKSSKQPTGIATMFSITEHGLESVTTSQHSKEHNLISEYPH